MKRKLGLFVLLFYFLGEIQNSRGGGLKVCKKDVTEQLFSAKNVVLGKVISIQKISTQTIYTIRVRKVYKSSSELLAKGDRVVVVHDSLLCKKVKVKSKYIFMLTHIDGSSWSSSFQPLRNTRKWLRIAGSMYCTSCRMVPVLKEMESQYTVQVGRTQKLRCRLTGGRYPRVQFSWFLQNQPINKTKYTRVRSRGFESVLSIRGSPRSAGNYKCVAKNSAGSSSMSTTVYVQGTGSRFCDSGYCMNAAACSIALIYPGEKQVICSCITGFSGDRCQYKEATLLSGEMTVVTILVLLVATIGLLIYLVAKLHLNPDNRRLQSGDDVSNNETYGCKAETTEIKKLTNNILENPVVYLKGVSSSNTIPLASSMSSVNSSGSIKARRPRAADNLVISLSENRRRHLDEVDIVDIHTTHKKQKEHRRSQKGLHKSKSEPQNLSDLKQDTDPDCQLLNPNITDLPQPSPLYVEPWDSARCVHSNVGINCTLCQEEADIIIENCTLSLVNSHIN